MQITHKKAPWGWSQHLSIERRDGKEIKARWDTIQMIKNEYLGEDVLAIEMYPSEVDVINEVNRRHLWTIPKEFLSLSLSGGHTWT